MTYNSGQPYHPPKRYSDHDAKNACSKRVIDVAFDDQTAEVIATLGI